MISSVIRKLGTLLGGGEQRGRAVAILGADHLLGRLREALDRGDRGLLALRAAHRRVEGRPTVDEERLQRDRGLDARLRTGA